jgi:putative peptidoglycan lipid II flippase
MASTRTVFISAIRVSASTLSVVVSSALVTIITTGSFGVSRQTDAYLVALAIPTMIVTILSLAPSLSAIAVLVQERAERGDRSEQILSSTLVWAIVGSVAPVLILLVLARQEAVGLIAPGFSDLDRGLTAGLMLLTAPAAFCNAIANGLGAILNARHRYAIAAMAPTIVNVVSGAVIVLVRDAGVIAWAWGYLAGSVAALGVLMVTTALVGQRQWLVVALDHPALRGLFSTVLPFVLLTALSQVSAIVVRSITSLLPGGVITALNIALTITNIPLGLSAYALGTTLVPAFARYLAEDPSQVQILFRRAIRLLELALAPVVALTFVLAQPLIRVLFERGAFDAHATELTAEVLRIYVLSLLAQPFVVVAHRALLGGRATRTLLVVGVIETGSLAVLTFALSAGFAHEGVAAAYVLSVVVNAALLTVASVRAFHRADVLGSIAFAIATSALAAVGSAAAFAIVSLEPVSIGRIGGALWIVAAAAVGAAVYLALVWASPLSTIAELRGLLARRLSRPA